MADVIEADFKRMSSLSQPAPNALTAIAGNA